MNDVLIAAELVNEVNWTEIRGSGAGHAGPSATTATPTSSSPSAGAGTSALSPVALAPKSYRKSWSAGCASSVPVSRRAANKSCDSPGGRYPH